MRLRVTASLLPAALVLLNANALAQQTGTVTFGNTSSTLVTNAQTGVPVTTADNVQTALYWSSPDQTTLVQIGASVPVGAPGQGLFFGGTRTTGPNTPAGTAKFQVKAWAGGYPNYEAAATNAGVLLGQSPVFTNPTGDPNSSPPFPPPYPLLTSGLQGFSLAPNVLPAVLTINPANNNSVNCADAWNFDTPAASTTCSDTNVAIAVLDTVTNQQGCSSVVTRSWLITDNCGNSNTCSQVVTVLCTNCPVLQLAKQCPPYPVPPGGNLVFTGTITNISSFALTNVTVLNDRPAPNTLILGPVTLLAGQGLSFTGSYPVAACDCGPHANTLTATAGDEFGEFFTASLTAICPGTNWVTPGDLNGDGIVDQNELNQVLANYWAHAPALYMMDPAAQCNGQLQFVLTNISAWNFTVLVSSNFVDWTNLPNPAFPVYQFQDPAATNSDLRVYRLRYP